ncbi:selenoprotein K [Elysia marginata]|uniref:Selenoprotein K n=1 Tax=Elysia marginata TaxID=1093978 RepID=A0AAV4G9R2_9GAST|nr:selenoprotein K [Elysia marginata]
MPYISNGQVVESRSIWRLSFITDAFWGIINFVVLFLVKIQKVTDIHQTTEDQVLVLVEDRGDPGEEWEDLVDVGEPRVRRLWPVVDEAGRG